MDGNVLRVLMRVTACGDDVLSQKTKSRVADALRGIYPSGEDAGLLTEGLMELGETLCLPNGEPRCDGCPLRELCLARAEGLTAELPRRRAKKERRILPPRKAQRRRRPRRAGNSGAKPRRNPPMWGIEAYFYPCRVAYERIFRRFIQAKWGISVEKAG